MYYTVYKTTNNINQKIYIGVHKTSKLKDNYIGSGVTLNKAVLKYGFENFTKEIIFRAVSEPIMYWIERMLVDEEFINLPYVYNEKVGGQGGFKKGKASVKDKEGKTFQVDIDDPRYISGELVGHSAGKVSVKDKEGKIFQVDLFDERYLSGELKMINLGKVLVKDKYGNKFQVDLFDERYLSGELVGVNKHFTVCKDRSGNIIRVSITDERLISGELVSINLGRRFNVQKPKTYLTCPNCLKTGSRNMTRYHFENCKNLSNSPI